MVFIPVYILILFFTIIIDYIAGIFIEDSTGPRRKLFLTLSIIANTGVLIVFKYYNFFVENINTVLHSIHLSGQYLPFLNIILPIGLSFHTFQAMSYTIEVYRGNQKAERHLGIYSLYVMFFPQLLAGPIERPQNMLHQFHEEKEIDYASIVSGVKLMAWGLFKKSVIADRLAILVDPVFENSHSYKPIVVAIAALFYTYQIYCDFSGYSDMAIGAARVLGFKLMRNFNRPYSSKNVSEFWTRWHISLSTWFKDYLYIPLGGNRVSIPRWYLNLTIVFLVSGLWHGANWTFVAWGAIHAFYLIFALVTQKYRVNFNNLIGLKEGKPLSNAVQRASTFSLVVFAFIFFRASNIHSALAVCSETLTAIVTLPKTLLSYHGNLLGTNCPMTWPLLLFTFGLLFILEIVQYINSKRSLSSLLEVQPIYLRWAIYYSIFFLILLGGVFTNRHFIYFQF